MEPHPRRPPGCGRPRRPVPRRHGLGLLAWQLAVVAVGAVLIWFGRRTPSTLLARLAPRATKATVSSISSDGTFLVAPWWNQLLGWAPTRAGTTVDEQSALALPIVYACVRVIAESIASLPLITYRRTENGGKERVPESPFYSLFHDAPNPEMTSFGWRETVMTHLTTWGNTFNEITEGRGGETQIRPLPPSRVEVGWELGRKVYDYLTDAGQKKRLDTGRVWHIPGLSTNGLVGLSPIQAHRESLGEMMATRDFGSSFYRNNARPAAVLEHPATLSAGAIERLATQMDQLRGTGNAGKTIVMEEGMKLHEVGVPPEDAQYIETRKLQREDVARSTACRRTWSASSTTPRSATSSTRASTSSSTPCGRGSSASSRASRRSSWPTSPTCSSSSSSMASSAATPRRGPRRSPSSSSTRRSHVNEWREIENRNP